MLLNIFCTLNIAIYNIVHISLDCGMTPSILNGVLSFASALLPNILDSVLRTPLFLSLMMSPILLTMISPPLNILFAILTGNFILRKLPCVDRIVWDVLIWLTLLIHALIISLCVILYTKLYFDTFLPVLLIMLLVSTSLSSCPVLFVCIVIIVRRQLNTFSGIVPDGLLFVKNTPCFFVFLVLLVANGPHVFYTVDGSNVIAIMESPYFIIWILLIPFQILLIIPIICFLKFFLLVMLHLRCFVLLLKLPLIAPLPPLLPTLLTPLRAPLYSCQRTFHRFHFCTALVNKAIQSRHLRAKKKNTISQRRAHICQKATISGCCRGAWIILGDQLADVSKLSQRSCMNSPTGKKYRRKHMNKNGSSHMSLRSSKNPPNPFHPPQKTKPKKKEINLLCHWINVRIMGFVYLPCLGRWDGPNFKGIQVACGLRSWGVDIKRLVDEPGIVFPESLRIKARPYLGGGNSNMFFFIPIPGEMIQFDDFFQMGWNHQLDPTSYFLWGGRCFIEVWEGLGSHVADVVTTRHDSDAEMILAGHGRTFWWTIEQLQNWRENETFEKTTKHSNIKTLV